MLLKLLCQAHTRLLYFNLRIDGVLLDIHCNNSREHICTHGFVCIPAGGISRSVAAGVYSGRFVFMIGRFHANGVPT